MTATRTAKALTVAAAAAAWGVAAWLLSRTSVPPLRLGGLDAHRDFSAHDLHRAARYSDGWRALWLAATASSLLALWVLARRLPPKVRSMGLGPVGAAIVAGTVVLVTLWLVALPFGIASLWWDHHWRLGPFGVGTWLDACWALLTTQEASTMLGLALVVWLAGRFPRGWWLPAAAAVVAVVAAFALVEGWVSATGAHPLRDPRLRADVARLERDERVERTPVAVQDVSPWTHEANAFTSGFGPSAHVVLWNTLLDGRFSRREIDVVVAHELGHVRSRHVLKAIGWSALTAPLTLLLLGLATRRRGGLGDPANVPYAILVLTVLVLLTAPLQNAVSRRYEAEADWRALNATRDPSAARALFRGFARTSLEQPSPPLWDYLWLENHPTLLQRIAMTLRWRRGR